MKKTLPLFILLVSLLFIVGITHSAGARSVNVETGTTVTISEDSDRALFVSGQDILIDGDIDGALFAAGNSITIKGNVNGPLFAAGNSITIEGTIEGEVFLAGNTIRTLAEAGFSRDAFMAGSQILIDGTIGRDVFGGSERFELNNTVGRNAHLHSDTMNFTNNATVGGNLFYHSDTEVADINQYVEGEVRYEEMNRITGRQEMTQQTIYRRIINMVGALVSALIIWWVFRRMTQNRWLTVSQHILKRPISTMLIGLGLLLLMPILIILAFVSRVLSDIGFFLVLFFFLLLFLTRLITASIIGKHLLERRFSFNTSNAFVSFLVAYLLLSLIDLIPIIGGIITFLSIIFAIGLVFRESLQRIQRASPNQPLL